MVERIVVSGTIRWILHQCSAIKEERRGCIKAEIKHNLHNVSKQPSVTTTRNSNSTGTNLELRNSSKPFLIRFPLKPNNLYTVWNHKLGKYCYVIMLQWVSLQTIKFILVIIQKIDRKNSDFEIKRKCTFYSPLS